MDPGYNLEFCAPSTGLTKCDRRPRRIGRRDPSTGGEDELAMAVSGPAHKYTRVQRPLFGMCGRPVRRLERAHRDGGVCDRTFVLARCGGCLSPAARTHTGRLPERARSAHHGRWPGPVRATQLPEHRRAVLPLTPIPARLQSAVRAQIPRTCRPATYRPGGGPNSEHAAG